jgi:hypothetical protein
MDPLPLKEDTMAQTPRSPDTPRTESDDRLTVDAPPPDAAYGEPNTPQAQVSAALAAMSASGPGAEAGYQASLSALAEDAPAVVQALSDRYANAPEDEYVDRWAMVNLLADVRQPQALTALEAIVSTPIPPEHNPGMVIHSTVSEEVIIRTTAIEGITRLASQGADGALEALRNQMANKTFSIRRAAIQGYLEAAGDDARDQLRSELPESDHFILDLRREDVRNVPQPRPEQAPSDAADLVPPPRIPLAPRTDK